MQCRIIKETVHDGKQLQFPLLYLYSIVHCM